MATRAPTQAVILVDTVGNVVGVSAGSVLPTGTNRSGAITTGGTAQTLAAANATRIGLEIQNIDATEDMWLNEIGGAAALNTAGSYKIGAGSSARVRTNQAVSVIAATTGHKWTATEW